MPESSRQLEIFTRRLRETREMRELSQDALAERAKLQPSAISHFETGNRKPSFDNLRRLADALDVTTDYLLGRTGQLDGLAATDRLHRHFERLTTQDREFAEELLRLLAEKKSKR